MKKIAGVVILYNPGNDTLDNILTYNDNLDTLIVMDNSDFPNEWLVKELRTISKVQYIKNSENMGIAYPLNRALEMTKEHYQWLLTMDQDSSFKEGEFSKYIKNLETIDCDVYGLTPIFCGDRVSLKDEDRSIIEHCITSGMLLKIQAAITVGGFDELLFIDAVDDEFCYRANVAGMGKIIRDNTIMLNHSIGAPKMHRLLGIKNYETDNHNYIRKYYMFRNYLYVGKKYPEKKKFYRSVLINNFIKILLGEKDKKRKIKSAILGYKDYIQGNMGKKIIAKEGKA